MKKGSLPLNPHEVVSAQSLTREQKVAALRRIVSSSTFSRSPQLRKFLRHLEKAVQEGTEDQLKEFSIGTDALGRGPDFDPTLDPIVRVQAARLRQKLDEYHRVEGSADPIITGVPKGSYIPAFVVGPVRPPTQESPSIHLAETSVTTVSSIRWREWLAPKTVVMIVLSALLVVFLLLEFSSDTRTSNPDGPVALEDLFAPFLVSRVPTILSFHVPELVTHGRGPLEEAAPTSNQDAGLRHLPAGAERLAQGLDERPGILTGTGELIGSLLLSQVLTRYGHTLQVKPSTALQWDDFKRANVIILGGPRQMEIFRELQAGLNFVYPYRQPGRVLNVRPEPGEAAAYHSELDSSRTGVDYAVVSKLNDPVSGYAILLFGGNTGISVEAGVRYFTNPLHVKFLLQRLRATSSALPASYQVLLRVVSRNASPVDIEYVAHRVIVTE